MNNLNKGSLTRTSSNSALTRKQTPEEIKDIMISVIDRLELAKATKNIKLVSDFIEKVMPQYNNVKMTKNEGNVKYIKDYIKKTYEKYKEVINKNNNNKYQKKNSFDNLFALIKAAFRLQFNVSLDENPESILNKLRYSTKADKIRSNIYSNLSKYGVTSLIRRRRTGKYNDTNMALARVRQVAIPVAANNMEGFHNFTNIEYFVYTKENFDFNGKDDNQIRLELIERAPYYFQNGLMIINNNRKIIDNFISDPRNIKALTKAVQKNLTPLLNDPELNKMKIDPSTLDLVFSINEKIVADSKKNNKNKKFSEEIIEQKFKEKINDLYKIVDDTNKSQILQKFFTDFIDDPANPEFKSGRIDIEGFEERSKDMAYNFDTIRIFDKNKFVHILDRKNNTDKGIEYTVNKNNTKLVGGAKISFKNLKLVKQVGGVDPVSAFAALCVVGGFLGALVQCTGVYNGVKGVLNAIKRIPGYLFCVIIDTFAIAIIIFIMCFGLVASLCLGVPPSPYSGYTTYTLSGYYGRPYDFSGLIYTPKTEKSENEIQNKKKKISNYNLQIPKKYERY